MKEVKYVIRFFSDNDVYLYSVHCGFDILDDLLKEAKDNGKKVKVLAYSSSESEV